MVGGGGNQLELSLHVAHSSPDGPAFQEGDITTDFPIHGLLYMLKHSVINIKRMRGEDYWWRLLHTRRHLNPHSVFISHSSSAVTGRSVMNHKRLFWFYQYLAYYYICPWSVFSWSNRRPGAAPGGLGCFLIADRLLVRCDCVRSCIVYSPLTVDRVIMLP